MRLHLKPLVGRILTLISEAMAFYGLHRDFEHAGYFPTPYDEKIFDALKVAVRQGHLVVLSGIVGCGKSKLEARKFKRYFSVSLRGAAPRELTIGARVAAAYAPAEGRRPNAPRPRQGPFFKRLLFGNGAQKAQGKKDRAGGGFAHRRERRQEGWKKA